MVEPTAAWSSPDQANDGRDQDEADDNGREAEQETEGLHTRSPRALTFSVHARPEAAVSRG
ncbi:MAG: hypothetical protein HY262_02120 [Chloroflexi bacterium]|nr:hypothetical protein [Chloroflexota bacterium]